MIRNAALTVLAAAIALGMLLHRNSGELGIWIGLYALPLVYLGLAMAGRYYASAGGFMFFYFLVAAFWVGFEETKIGLTHFFLHRHLPDEHWELAEAAGLLLCATGFAAAFVCWCLRIARKEDQDDLRWWNEYIE